MNDLDIALKIKAIDHATKVIDRVGRKFVQQVKEGTISVEQCSAKIDTMGKTATVAGAALTGMSALNVKAFSNIEKGLTNVYTLLDRDQLVKFRSNIDNTANSAIKMGFTIDDTTTALFDSISAIGDVEKSLEVYNEAQKLAIGGNADLAVSVDGMTSIMNAYHLATDEATKIAVAFFRAQKVGKTDVQKMASNVGKIAPVAKSAGVSYQELLSTMAVLTKAGLSTDEATTALRASMSALIKPTKEAETMLKKYGVPVGAVDIKSKGWCETLKALIKAGKEHEDELAQMIPNIRALTAVTSLGEKEFALMSETIAQMNKDIKKGTGLSEAYALQMKTTDKATSMLWGSIKSLSASIGEGLAPVVKVISYVLTGFVNVLNLIPAPLKSLGVITTTIAGVGLTALGCFTMAMANVLNLVNALSPALATRMAPAIARITVASWGWVASIVANPLTWIVFAWVAGLTAVGTIVYQLYKNWDKVTASIIKAFNWTKKLFGLGSKNDVTPKVTTNIQGSHSQGAWDIPQDHLAMIHEGEMIVPKRFASAIRDKGQISGGSISVNYSPVINLAGNLSQAKEDFKQMLKKHKDEIINMVSDAQRNQLRTAF